MTLQLRSMWQSRAPRERMLIAAAGVVLAAALYLLLVETASTARARLVGKVAASRVQVLRIEQQAGEIQQLRATPTVVPAATDLRGIVQTQAAAAGLSSVLTRIDASGGDEVQVTLGAVPFADWLRWVASLQAQQVRLHTCRIEALAQPGMVSVSATLQRPRP